MCQGIVARGGIDFEPHQNTGTFGGENSAIESPKGDGWHAQSHAGWPSARPEDAVHVGGKQVRAGALAEHRQGDGEARY